MIRAQNKKHKFFLQFTRKIFPVNTDQYKMQEDVKVKKLSEELLENMQNGVL